MDLNIDEYKKEFVELLRSTEREGVDYVIEDLEKAGFFEAPASAGHHLNCKGGLVAHSVNTYRAAKAIFEAMKPLEPTLAKEVKNDSLILAALLHDVCKTDIYKPTVKRRKNEIGLWEDVPGYRVSYRDFPMGHGEKSVTMLLLSGLDLHDDELLAIRWHMGAFGLNMNSLEDTRNYDAARTLYPLVSIVQSADSMAASILERQAADIDDL